MAYEYLIRRPDDWHVHLRDGDKLKDTTAATAAHFSRALVMPNLKPALTSVEQVLAYRERILACLPFLPAPARQFNPFMTLYLNERVDLSTFAQLAKYPFILGAKLYPAGATTNAEEGARSLSALDDHFKALEENDLVLQIHGEMAKGDIFHREAKFIKTILLPLTKRFPKLRIVLEHISTQAAVEFIENASEYLAATVTPQHLFYNRNHLLSAGLKPHFYCLPLLKQRKDQKALQAAVLSGNPKFFAGTDSAPHAQGQKESACGCAGIFSAPFAVALYAELFDKLGAIHRLDHFLGRFGAEFYRLALNQEALYLKKEAQTVPASLPFGQDTVIPMEAGQILSWRVVEQTSP